MLIRTAAQKQCDVCGRQRSSLHGCLNHVAFELPPLLLLLCVNVCRNPASFSYNRHYETNGWFYVEDVMVNLAKNRFVITMPFFGMPVSVACCVASS